MAAVQDLTQGRTTTGIAFVVERIDWPVDDRLEIRGRWFGVRGRRFIRPTLDLEVDGEPRRLLAVLDHKPWAVEDGEEWVAGFEWEGGPAEIAGAELTVGPDISVELQAPGVGAGQKRSPARRPRADLLEDELARARAEAQRLRRELHAARADRLAEADRGAAEREAELERLRAEQQVADRQAELRAAGLRSELDAERARVRTLESELQQARADLAVARADLAAQREQLEGERAALAADASRAAAAELDQLRRERDAARRESVEARAERDAARRESVKARGERDAAFRERDRARQERDAWVSRTRGDGTKRRAAELPSPAAERTALAPAPPVVGSPAAAATEPVPITPRVRPARLPLSQPSLSTRILAVAALVALCAALALLIAAAF